MGIDAWAVPILQLSIFGFRPTIIYQYAFNTDIQIMSMVKGVQSIQI